MLNMSIWQAQTPALHSSRETHDRTPGTEVTRTDDQLVTEARRKKTENVAMVQNPKEAWTAVLDKPTGGVYWWNRQTGVHAALQPCKPTIVVQNYVYPLLAGKGPRYIYDELLSDVTGNNWIIPTTFWRGLGHASRCHTGWTWEVLLYFNLKGFYLRTRIKRVHGFPLVFPNIHQVWQHCQGENGLVLPDFIIFTERLLVLAQPVDEEAVLHTGQTTAVGAPKPGSLGAASPFMGQRVPAGRALMSMAAVGAGMGLMFGIIGKIFWHATYKAVLICSCQQEWPSMILMYVSPHWKWLERGHCRSRNSSSAVDFAKVKFTRSDQNLPWSQNRTYFDSLSRS